MKVAEILRTIANIIDLAQEQEPAATIVEPVVEPEDTTVTQITKLAGITTANTTPEEQVFPLVAAFPSGTDMHASKNPSDIRADSVSMYPGYGAQK
jgi:hypothetical protein